MNLRNVDMQEVTRLTRAGRLNEAMSLLRGAFGTTRRDENVAPGSTRRGQLASPSPTNSFAKKSAPSIETLLPPVLRRFDRKLPGRVFDGLLPGLDGAPLQQPRTFKGPPGSRFEKRSFSNQAGTRNYKLYVPSKYSGDRLPLLVMLHGCTQSPDDFALGTRMNDLAEEFSLLVAYPEQPKSANVSKCWNWFNAAEQVRDSGEPSLIAGITRQIVDEFPVDPAQIFVAGLSAGGATASIMASTYPDLFAAVGIHSGLPCGAAHDVQSAFAAMRNGGRVSDFSKSCKVPTIIFHGDRDNTVNPVNAERIVVQASGGKHLKTEIHLGTSAEGVAFTRTVHLDIDKRPVLENWVIHGSGHAWSGGSSEGSFTDPRGPDASREMARFFLQQIKP